MHLSASDIQRFWKGLAPSDEGGCRVWTRSIASTGYGNIRIGGATYLTHRVAYVIAHGDIPDGLQIDHLCRVRACSEITHLEAVTPAVNTSRTAPYRVISTSCWRGHPLSEDNVRRYNGSRFCKECDRIRGREYRARIREQERPK